MNPEVVKDLNSLLAYLHEFDVVTLVNRYYQRYGNDTPAKLLKKRIEKIQHHLDQESNQCPTS